MFETTEETTEPTTSEIIFANKTKTSEFSTAITFPFTREVTFLTSTPTSAQTTTEDIISTKHPIEPSTLEPFSKTPKSINWTEKVTTLEYTTEISSSSTSISLDTSSSSTEEPTTITEIVTATSQKPDCAITPCQNGGTCIVTVEGSQVKTLFFYVLNGVLKF